MTSRLQMMIIGIILILLGLFFVWYKSAYLGIPLVPFEKKTVWSIGAKLSAVGNGGPMELSLALPPEQRGYKILRREAHASDFGFATAPTSWGERAEWTKRRTQGKQILFYNLDVVADSYAKVMQQENAYVPVMQPAEAMTEWSETLRDAADILLNEIWEKSADHHSFAAQLILHFNSGEISKSEENMLQECHGDLAVLIHRLLRAKDIPARIVKAIILKDGSHFGTLPTYLEVYNGKFWQLFDVHQGKIAHPGDLFIWQRGGPSLLDVIGSRENRITFSVTSHLVPSKELATYESNLKSSTLLSFSLYSLPSSGQNSFKYILLIPIGAIVVVFMRIFVGLRTSGTFMPVLIAIAFMETQLLNGLIMFLTVIALGLIIRSYLSQIHLLLVARLSAVIVVVVMLMSVLSVLSFKLGFEDVLTITFFPMIILSWTIERMSILWEEEGVREVLIQGGGSLIVATIAYLVMSNVEVAHLAFNFPELLFSELGLIVLMGRYTGYRLSELLRFAPLVGKS